MHAGSAVAVAFGTEDVAVRDRSKAVATQLGDVSPVRQWLTVIDSH
jgi:hypothetical protein